MIETQSYSEFSQAIHADAARKRVPTNVQIEVTHRCSLNCAHCYNNLPMHDSAAQQQELTYAEMCRVLDEIAEEGCLWLCFTGGEIFARRDFLEIYTYAKRKGFIITLFTNGTLITERIADYLAELPPFSIEITLYGRTKETYERLTGIPGSHERCLRGIQLLLERKLPLKLKTVGTSINKHEVYAMQQFASELGCEFKFDSLINPRTNCSHSPLEVRLAPEEVTALDLQDPKRVAEYRALIEFWLDPARELPRSDQVYRCGGGVTAFAIDPQGSLTLCVLSHQEGYDLRQGDFKTGWEDFLFRVRTKKTTRQLKCHRCRLQNTCGMCPANGELENHDPEAPVDFLCRTTHLRAYVLGYEPPEHGACESCPGGCYYDELQQLAAELRADNRHKRYASQKFLPVLSTTNGQSDALGCLSCSSR